MFLPIRNDTYFLKKVSCTSPARILASNLMNISFRSCMKVPSSPTRSQAIDLTKALSILGVLFAHMFYVSRLNATALHTIHHMQLIFGWCVIAFFFCSGILSKTLASCKQFLSYGIVRAERLLIPCLVFSLTNKVVCLLLSHYGLIGVSISWPHTWVTSSTSFWFRLGLSSISCPICSSSLW